MNEATATDIQSPTLPTDRPTADERRPRDSGSVFDGLTVAEIATLAPHQLQFVREVVQRTFRTPAYSSFSFHVAPDGVAEITMRFADGLPTLPGLVGLLKQVASDPAKLATLGSLLGIPSSEVPKTKRKRASRAKRGEQASIPGTETP